MVTGLTSRYPWTDVGAQVTWSGDLLKMLELNQQEIFADTGARLQCSKRSRFPFVSSSFPNNHGI